MPAMTSQIGVTGLAVMGANLARNLARHGHQVVLHNRTQARTDTLMAAHGTEGDFVPTTSVEEFVAALERPRRVLVMVAAGAPTDAVLTGLVPHLDEGDVVIDGGNARFTDTIRRTTELAAKGLHFVGAGVSGGEEGALNGPSIMPGGSAQSYESLGPILTKISAHVNGEPCCVHVGPDGAGHFVKMLHNGIEYADMQLIAEAYDLLRHVLGLSPAELADVFRDWNSGDLESFLIEITAEVLSQTDPTTGGPFVDVVLDQAEQKGTGRWTGQSALDLGIPVSGMAEAVFARSLSGDVVRREAAAGVLPGPAETKADVDRDAFIDDVRHALYSSKLVAYAQGFDAIRAASDQYDWNIDLGAMATIWRGGCIIRARFLDRIKEAYDRNADLPSLLVDDYFKEAVANGQEAWRRVIATAAAVAVPAPGFSAALSYYDGLRRDRLPAALIQGLRDNFGAHTYQRVDKAGSFHTAWAEDRTESPT